MAVALQQLVKTRGGFFSFGTRPAVIELHDDHRFVMFAIDKVTQARTDTLMDTPLSGLRVRKQQALLLFSSGSIRRRVDFSDGSEYIGFAAAGLVGLAIAGAVAQPKSGILTWIAALRANGVQVKTPVVSTAFLVIIGIPIVLTLILVVAAIASNLSS